MTDPQTIVKVRFPDTPATLYEYYVPSKFSGVMAGDKVVVLTPQNGYKVVDVVGDPYERPWKRTTKPIIGLVDKTLMKEWNDQQRVYVNFSQVVDGLSKGRRYARDEKPHRTYSLHHKQLTYSSGDTGGYTAFTFEDASATDWHLVQEKD